MAEFLAVADNFHFQRPGWFFALMPALALAFLLRRPAPYLGTWQRVINPELLPYLMRGKPAKSSSFRILLPALFWFLAVFGLAGPSWHEQPASVFQLQRPLVILFDLSPSMLAQDIKPDRLTRARLKLIELLEQRREGTTALVAYADDAHIVTPLTDDVSTIKSLALALHPDLMPIPGSNPVRAVAAAVDLIVQAGHGRGDILLITDGIDPGDSAAITRQLSGGTDLTISVLGIGSERGAPIPTARGGFLRDGRGDIIIAQLAQDALRQLAERNQGLYFLFDATDSDIRSLLEHWTHVGDDNSKALDRRFDIWRDEAHWLALLLLPLCILVFRKNLVLCVAAFGTVTFSEVSPALDWHDLWQRGDQQGIQAFTENDMETALDKFETPNWKGAAAYKSQQYDLAKEIYSEDLSAGGRYNLGNTLAQIGDYEGAITAYEAALEQDPKLEDAHVNKRLIEDLLEQARRQNPAQSESGQTSNEDNDAANARQADGDVDPRQQHADSGADAEDPSPNNAQRADDKPEYNPRKAMDQQAPQEESEDNQSREALPERSEADGGEKHEAGADVAKTKDSLTDDDTGNRAGQARDKDDELRDQLEEEQRAREAWLRRVPDNPGGLLRRKFQYEAWLRSRGGQQQEHRDNTARPDRERW